MELSSLRSAGGNIIGKIYKGSHLGKKSLSNSFSIDAVPNSPNSPSIFLNNPKHKSPGPGNYEIQPLSNPSFSKKGFGGLINRESRFKKSESTTYSPGPGTYTEPIPPSKSVTSVFVLPNSKTQKIILSPAPGQYDPKIIKKSVAYTSVFNSKSKRINYFDNDFPAPWQYTPMLPKSSTSVVMKKKIDNIKKDIKFYENAEKQKFSSPGPGEYEINRKSQTLKPSPMFKDTKKDRFGNLLGEKIKENKIPGPGSYFNQEKIEKKDGSKHPTFASNSDRNLLEKKHIPGPAYYSPKLSDKKKSFINNKFNIWV